MMMNMFSIFDPLNMNPMIMKPFNNWYSMLIPLMLVPLQLKNNKKTASSMMESLLYLNMKELSYNMLKSTKAQMIMLAIFSWILLTNMSSLLPYIFPSNTHMAITFTLAVTLTSAMETYANINMPKKILIHLIPKNTPMILAPFMVLIELISNSIRPMTLAIRLTANILAGHIILSILLSSNLHFTMNWIMIPAQISLMTMELVVAYIQAYVFMTLLSLYASQNNN